MHQAIRDELENLALQFPGRSQIDLDEYAALYKIDRKYASKHLKRRGIPATKEGKCIYISIIDLATYKAQHKARAENRVIIKPMAYAEEMKSRRGFSQQAARRKLQPGGGKL